MQKVGGNKTTPLMQEVRKITHVHQSESNPEKLQEKTT